MPGRRAKLEGKGEEAAGKGGEVAHYAWLQRRLPHPVGLFVYTDPVSRLLYAAPFQAKHILFIFQNKGEKRGAGASVDHRRERGCVALTLVKLDCQVFLFGIVVRRTSYDVQQVFGLGSKPLHCSAYDGQFGRMSLSTVYDVTCA